MLGKIGAGLKILQNLKTRKMGQPFNRLRVTKKPDLKREAMILC